MKKTFYRSLSWMLSVVMILGLFTVSGIPDIEANATYTPADGDFGEYVRNNYDSADIFAADTIIEGLDGSDPIYYSGINGSKFYRVVAEAAVEDTGLMFSSLYWNEIQYVLKSDYVTMDNWQEMFYETLLMDYLAYEADSGSVKQDFEVKTMKYSKTVFKSIVTEANKLYEGNVDKILKEGTLSDAVEFSDKYGYINKLNDYSSLLSNIKTVSTTFVDYCKNLSKALAMRELNETRIDFLKKIKASAPDDYYLGKAVDNIVKKFTENKAQLSVQVFNETFYKATVKEVWSKIVSNIASAEVKAILAGINLGSATLDYVFNNNDNANSNLKMAMMCNLSYLCDISLRNLKDEYLSNKTEENAKAFVNGYFNYFRFQKYATTFTKKFMNQILFEGLYNKLQNTFSNNNQMIYDDFVSLFDKDQSIYQKYNEVAANYYELYKTITSGQLNPLEDETVHVTGIAFPKSSVEWGVDDGFVSDFEAVITPENAENKYVTYTSSDESVISYEKGFSFPYIHKEGTVTVTATTDDGGYSASMKVTVVKGHGTNGFYIQSNVGDGTIVETGNCGENGDNVKYTLYDNGLLYVYGSGNMKNYGYDHSPFNIYSNIKIIIINNGVTSIGDRAFYECSSVMSIQIPSSVKNIGNNALEGCELVCLTIPDSVTSIGDCAFYDCNSLTSITLPSGVTSIGNFAFYECHSLTSITIPDSVTSIGKSAFSGCSSLKSIRIPDSVTSIGGCAFIGCSSLTSITIPDSVTSIGEYAFQSCSSLTSITIPDSVTIIGEKAFGYYYGLTIYGKAGSEAERYAKDYGFKFVSTAVDTALKNSSSVSATTVTTGTEVTLTGKASGGTSPYKYAYYYKKSTESAWTKAYVTSSGSTYTKYDSVKFTPTTAGTYNVRINVKDEYGNGKVVSKEFTLTVKTAAALKNNTTVSATSVTTNTEVILNGKATGGTAPYKFAYYYKKSTESTWTKAYVTSSGSAYTKNTTVTFKPTTAGTYNVKVNAKDDEGTVVAKEFKVTVTEALKNSSTISATSVTANTAVTLTGNATGGTAPYTYAYYYKKSTDSSWTKVAGYSTATTKTFKPTSVGTYTARVNVKDSTGKLVQKDFTVTIKADTALKNNSIVSAETASLDTGVTITAKATGGTAPYKYAYYYKKTSASSWTVLDKVGSSAYSTNATARFKPSDAGTYNLRVNIKDNNGTGTAVTKDFTITVK